ALEAVLGGFGIPSRIVVDPSDLWALFALPIGYALSRPRAILAATPALQHARVRGLERAAVVLASLACVATAGSEHKKTKRSDAPEVENGSKETIVVVIASTEGRGGCKLYRSDRLGALTADAFRDPRVITL